MLELIEKLQEYYKKEKEKSRQDKLIYYFKEALEHFEIDRINEILESDFSLRKFEEQEGSSINLALLGFDNQIFDGYLTKKKCIDDAIEILKQYLKTEKEDLPPEMCTYLENTNKQLLYILENLYQHGANINLDERMIWEGNFFHDQKINYKVDSPLFSIIGRLDELKSEEAVNWILSKPELDIYKKNEGESVIKGESILSSLILLNTKLSIPLLKMFLEKGIKIDEFMLSDRYGVFVPNEKPLSTLHTCLLNSPEETREEKLEILSQYATPEQIAIFEKFREEKNASASYESSSQI